MIPTPLLISLAQREGTPLPALVEAFMMELTFEIIREAGFGCQGSLDQPFRLWGSRIGTGRCSGGPCVRCDGDRSFLYGYCEFCDPGF